MKKISIAFLAAVSLASFGCKKGGADIVARMAEFKDRMCACKDRACVDKVNDDMTRWTQELARSAADKEPKASEDDARKMIAVSEEMNKCMQKIVTGGGAAGDGAAGGSAAGSDGSAAAGGGAAAGSDTAGAGAGSASPPAGSGDGSGGSASK